MQKKFSLRVAFITGIFGAFGFGLIKLYDIKNLPTFVTGVGMLFSVILSFIVSTLFLSKLNASKRKWLALSAAGVFLVSVALYFFLQRVMDDHTVYLDQFSGDNTITNRYFKGSIYTPVAAAYIKNHPEVTDQDLVLALENNVVNVWTADSINSVVRYTTLFYYLFIFSIITSLSVLIELMSKKKGKA